MISATKSILKHMLFSVAPYFLKKNFSTTATTNEFGFALVLCHQHVTLFLFGFYSLFIALGKNHPIFIIDDGTLTNRDHQAILSHFPFATILSRTNSDRRIKKILNHYPLLKSHRFDSQLSNFKLKIDAVLLNPFKKFILMDPDILFLEKPTKIIDWRDTNSQTFLYTAHDETFFFKDYYPEFAFRTLLFKHLSLTMTGGFSSGLLCFPNKSIVDLAFLERNFELLKEVGYLKNNGAEECIFALLAAHVPSLCLNPKKYVVSSFWVELTNSDSTPIMNHYGWETKQRFPLQALRLAWRKKWFIFQ